MQEWTEWTAQTEIVANWKQEIESGGRKFGDVLAETKAQTKRPDITLFEKPQQKSPAIIVEIKVPHGLEDLDRLRLVLRTTGVKYAVTWDLVQFAVWKLEKGELRPQFHPQEMQVCTALAELKREDIRQRLRDASSKLLRELEFLYEKGTLTSITPPFTYFVNRLHRAVDELRPEVEKLLAKKRSQTLFSQKVDAWAVNQAMPIGLDNFNEIVASHWVYKTIARSIFYLTIQRDFEHKLPQLYDEHATDVGKSVLRAFDAASQVDWQAVFQTDELDEVLSEGLTFTPFSNLLHDLRTWEFRNLPHDVIGTVFERLIPEEERHSFGQYFTPIDLVDLMLGFVMKNCEGAYCDPTCGTGTFLIRAYNRLRWLSALALTHNQLLSRLWGIDIAHFPAELATISLFRQKPDDHHNFPRIIRRDTFQVKAGQKFEFPPPTAPRGEFKKVEVPFPQMRGLVGNFPYIRQEIIEKHSKEITKGKLSRLIADEMNGIYTDIIKNGTDIHLSGQADIYAYMFFHVYTFLEDGGRMAFLTSNSWLDTAFGQHLKRFFLRKFKVIAVVGSWAEPWFEDASVNTVFVVLERCDKPDHCMNHNARFVRLNKRLADLLPFNPETEESKRWNRVDAVIRSIENTPPRKTLGAVGVAEDENCSVRILSQKHLLEKLQRAGPNDKWGLYIRAPEIYFEILEVAKDKLVPLSQVANIRRGVTTGINEFFYLKQVPDKKPSKGKLYVRNERGWEGEIESTYLKKAIVSPKEAQTISINRDQLENYMFVCNESKSDLRKKGHLAALAYIENGEKQKTEKTKNTQGGVPWPEVSSVKNRQFWYGLGSWIPGNILVQMINNDRFLAFHNKDNVCVDHNLFEITCPPARLRSLLSLTNSTLFALFREVHSRVNLGDGATKTEGIDWQNMPIPDISSIPSLNTLPDPTSWDREIKSIDQETRMKDRRQLDAAVLEAIGLNPDYYLPRIYDGLVQLITERLQLPKMRKKARKQRAALPIDEIKSTLTQEILPNGLRKIDSFIQTRALFEHVPTTGKPLLLGDLLFDKQEILDEEGALVVTVQGSYAGRFVVHQYTPGNNSVLIPKLDNPNAPIQARHALQDYELYINKTREQIYARAFEMTIDASVADRIADELLAENGYYPVRHFPKKPRRKP